MGNLRIKGRYWGCYYRLCPYSCATPTRLKLIQCSTWRIPFRTMLLLYCVRFEMIQVCLVGWHLLKRQPLKLFLMLFSGAQLCRCCTSISMYRFTGIIFVFCVDNPVSISCGSVLLSCSLHFGPVAACSMMSGSTGKKFTT